MVWLGVEIMAQPKPKIGQSNNIEPVQGLLLVQNFYSLEQATQYLNIKYADNCFTPKSLLQAFIQHKLPCYFFFKNSDAMPLIEPEFSLTGDASNEDLNLVGDEIDWRLNSEIRDNGLLLQLPQPTLSQALIDHAIIDNNSPNCFCGVLVFNPELNTYQDFNAYMQDWIFKKHGKTLKFTFDNLMISIKLTTTTATDIESLRFYVTQEQIQKQHPQIIAFFAEYPKPNNEMQLHPTFKISALDLTVLYRDLEQIETMIKDNMAISNNESNEITNLTAQLEQKEQEINKLQAKIDQLQATATPANHALTLENLGYTTTHLEILKSVIQEFWINYQKEHIPPKQDTIIGWIMEQHGLTRAAAKAIDQVARPDITKTGGIKSRK